MRTMLDLIDVHAHHYPESYLQACQRRDSGFDSYVRDDGRLVVKQDGAVALAAPQPMPTTEERLRAMDEAGVDIQLLSVSAPNVYRFPAMWRPGLTRELNDELIDMSVSSELRLRTLISLPLPDMDASLAELDRALSQEGAAGVMLTTTIAGRSLDDAYFGPLLAELSARECVVLVHPTTACSTEGIRDYAMALGLDFLAETTNCIGRLVYSGTLESFPGIRWIFSHLGGTTPFLIHRFDNYFNQFPECREKIDRPPSEILRSVFFDTVTTHAPALRCALDTFDVSQLLFGTDYPHVPGGLKRFTATLDAMDLGAEDQAAIRWRSAANLLGIVDGEE
jgi:predicted TIM-barrel fold metal-dependent hydrolase